MQLVVKMPDLGTDADQPLIVGFWLADEGEEVWEGQDLVEIICREATFNVPCPVDGRLAEIRIFADEQVLPGQVLAIVESRPEDDVAWKDEG